MTPFSQRSQGQKMVIILILLSAFTGIGVGLLRSRGLDGTALLYIGMPTLLALSMVGAVGPSGSVTGATVKAITFVILISGPLLQEGYICMLMAAPILYFAGILAALPFDYYHKRKQQGAEVSKLNVSVLPVLLLLMSAEGTTESLTINRYQTQEHTAILALSEQQIRHRLSITSDIQQNHSGLLALFPKPDLIRSTGLAMGTTQSVEVTYNKWFYWNEKYGQLTFEVVDDRPGYIRFKTVSDSTYLHSYMDWGDTEIFFTALEDGKTQVTWKIHYVRKLDPAWYVQPIQAYAVGKTAEMLIANLQG